MVRLSLSGKPIQVPIKDSLFIEIKHMALQKRNLKFTKNFFRNHYCLDSHAVIDYYPSTLFE